MGIRFGNGPWLDESPTKKQLDRLTEQQLLDLIHWKRSIKHPFKKVLVNYVLSLGKLG